MKSSASFELELVKMFAELDETAFSVEEEKPRFSPELRVSEISLELEDRAPSS